MSWKIYQDLAGRPFAPDFGDGTGNSFAGNFTDNSVLYFNQYCDRRSGHRRCSTTRLHGHRDHQHHPERVRRPRMPGRPGPSTCSTNSEATCRAANCRRFPGSWRRPVIPNTRIGRSTTAPGTSPRSSTSWCPIPRCSARPSSSSTTTRPTAASTTSCRRHRRRQPLRGLDGQHRKRDRHDVHPERSDRPRHARAVPRDLALEQGRLRQFPGLRSHVGDPVHREAFRSLREAISRRGAVRWRAT